MRVWNEPYSRLSLRLDKLPPLKSHSSSVLLSKISGNSPAIAELTARKSRIRRQFNRILLNQLQEHEEGGLRGHPPLTTGRTRGRSTLLNCSKVFPLSAVCKGNPVYAKVFTINELQTSRGFISRARHQASLTLFLRHRSNAAASLYSIDNN